VDNHGRQPNSAAIVGAIAAAILIVSFFLPWETALGSASLVDIATKGGNYLRVLDWAMLGLLVVGSGLALAGAVARALQPSTSRGSAGLAVSGFLAAIAGYAIWFVEWSSSSSVVSYYGVSMGIGIWLGLTAAVVGIIAAAVDLRSIAPAVSFQAGPWSPQATGTLQPPAGWSGNAQPPAPAAPAWAAPAAAGWASGGSGRLTVVESGRSSTLMVNQGEQVLVGRDVDAKVRVSDPKASRRHASIQRSGTDWVVRDLGATNPTRLLGASGTAQTIQGEVRLPSGQLLIGDVLVTLFPTGA
jgi:hypothetical protein